MPSLIVSNQQPPYECTCGAKLYVSDVEHHTQQGLRNILDKERTRQIPPQYSWRRSVQTLRPPHFVPTTAGNSRGKDAQRSSRSHQLSPLHLWISDLSSPTLPSPLAKQGVCCGLKEDTCPTVPQTQRGM